MGNGAKRIPPYPRCLRIPACSLVQIDAARLGFAFGLMAGAGQQFSSGFVGSPLRVLRSAVFVAFRGRRKLGNPMRGASVESFLGKNHDSIFGIIMPLGRDVVQLMDVAPKLDMRLPEVPPSQTKRKDMPLLGVVFLGGIKI